MLPRKVVRMHFELGSLGTWDTARVRICNPTTSPRETRAGDRRGEIVSPKSRLQAGDRPGGMIVCLKDMGDLECGKEQASAESDDSYLAK